MKAAMGCEFPQMRPSDGLGPFLPFSLPPDAIWGILRRRAGKFDERVVRPLRSNLISLPQPLPRVTSPQDLMALVSPAIGWHCLS